MQGQQSKPSNPKYPYFEESSAAEVVNARIGDNADPRLREVMTILVKHLHAAIKEIEPTHEEWLTAINFLTETGHMCTQWRQEYILLSDVMDCVIAFYEKPCCPPFGKLCGVGHSKGSDPIYA